MRNCQRDKKIGKLQGSLTVEASLVLPIFLFATLSILYMNKFLLYHEQVQWMLTRIGREASLECAVAEDTILPDSLYLTAKARQYLKESDISVTLLRSEFDEERKEIHLVADYQVKVPFPIMNLPRFTFSQQSVARAFVGVESRRREEERENDDDMVYITRTGRVYHTTLQCTHLKLSISQVTYGDLDYLRSSGGGIYYPCEACAEGKNFHKEEDVFICNYGNRFHKFRSCSKLRRSIQEVSRSEVGNRLPCSTCGDEER